MRIKQKINDQVNSFEFNFDLSKEDYLEKILKLFRIENLYLCIYGLNKQKELICRLNECHVENFKIFKFSKKQQNVILEIGANMLSRIFHILEGGFDEIVVWSCYTDWESFVEDQSRKVSFFTFRKTTVTEKIPSFYLDFNFNHVYEVAIISDLSFHNSALITKDDILKILYS